MVDFIKIGELIFDIADKLEEKLHQFSVIGIGFRSEDKFLEEEEKRTGIKIPPILRKILLEYGDHALNFRIPNEEKTNRYIFGRGFMHDVSVFDWGGIQ